MHCHWCRNPNADDVDDERNLCDAHAAEYFGLPLSELHRMESEQLFELMDLAAA